jgi:hypothetical protein
LRSGYFSDPGWGGYYECYNSKNIDFALDQSGDMHLVYGGNASENLSYMKRTGGSWGAPVTISQSVDILSASIAVDGNGNPHIAYTDDGNAVTYAEVLKMAFEAAGTDLGFPPPPRNASAKGTWAASYVASAEARGTPVITPDLDVYRPATRAEVVAMILSILNLPVATGQQPSFSDVPGTHPYAGAIATAAFYGLVQGNPDGTFRPDAPVNRAEVAKLIATLHELRRQ